MRPFILLTLFFLTFSCVDSNKSKDSTIDSLQKSNKPSISKELDELNDKIQYIGFVNQFYFSNNNEVFVELYFLKGVSNRLDYNELVNLSDSLIYEDEENSRHKFPIGLSTKYFDVRGLSKLKLYDKNNQFICNAKFLRVEYFNQNISSQFVAVFKTEKRIKQDRYYGISNFSGSFQEKKIYDKEGFNLLAKNIEKAKRKNAY